MTKKWENGFDPLPQPVTLAHVAWMERPDPETGGEMPLAVSAAQWHRFKRAGLDMSRFELSE